MPPRTRGFYDVANRRDTRPVRVASVREYEEIGWSRQRQERLVLMTQVTDRANTLRAMFEGDYSNETHRYPNGPFELRDTKSGLWVGGTVTGQAQAMRCKFCKKQVASWPSMPKNKKSKGRINWPDPLTNALHGHIEKCAYEWLRIVIAKESTGFLTDIECKHYHEWMQTCMKPPNERDRDYRDYNTRPRELEPLFKNNPHPPGSDMAQNLEVALIAISRMWSY